VRDAHMWTADETAPAIALPNGEHGSISNLRGEYTGTPQDLVARDIENLRTETSAPEESIQALIDLIKTTYPGTFGDDGPSAEEGGVGGE
jgi:hypothetical protein